MGVLTVFHYNVRNRETKVDTRIGFSMFLFAFNKHKPKQLSYSATTVINYGQKLCFQFFFE